MFTLGSALAAGPCTTGAFCQQHVAIGASGQLTISWVSAGASAALQWGVSSALPLPQRATASTETYSLTDLCEPNLVALRGWEEPAPQHHGDHRLRRRDRAVVRVSDGTTWGNVTGPVRIRRASRASPSSATWAPTNTRPRATRSAPSTRTSPRLSSAPRRRSTRSFTSATLRTRMRTMAGVAVAILDGGDRNRRRRWTARVRRAVDGGLRQSRLPLRQLAQAAVGGIDPLRRRGRRPVRRAVQRAVQNARRPDADRRLARVAQRHAQQPLLLLRRRVRPTS